MRDRVCVAQVRLTREEGERLDQLADSLGFSVEDLIRMEFGLKPFGELRVGHAGRRHLHVVRPLSMQHGGELRR